MKSLLLKIATKPVIFAVGKEKHHDSKRDDTARKAC